MLFFVGYEKASGFTLWKSDGTTAGTVRVTDKFAFSGWFTHGLTSLGGKLYFSADDGSSGRELWRSDGTEAGTTQVIDLVPGAIGSNPSQLATIDGVLFFAAGDHTHGYEVWRSDGTAVGTWLIADIVPGPSGSNPGSFVRAGNRVFFSADDGTRGQELWAVSTGVDAYLQTPALVGGAPQGVAAIPIAYGNHGLLSAGMLTVTATLDPALSYLSDTSGVTPTVSRKTITWHIQGEQLANQAAFTLRVALPNAPFGTRYPVTLNLAAAADSYPADNTRQIQIMVARQVFLPAVAR